MFVFCDYDCDCDADRIPNVNEVIEVGYDLDKPTETWWRGIVTAVRLLDARTATLGVSLIDGTKLLLLWPEPDNDVRHLNQRCAGLQCDGCH